MSTEISNIITSAESAHNSVQQEAEDAFDAVIATQTDIKARSIAALDSAIDAKIEEAAIIADRGGASASSLVEIRDLKVTGK